SQEARAGLSEFRIPRDMDRQLFDFQKAAVQIAAHHVNKRGGVLIGDVVGLGKTLMATALARILQDDFTYETLIICPRNLVKMWQDYVDRYRLVAKVLSLTQAQNDLPNLRRYRVVLIDESHNLRNREGKRYKAIKDYIEKNDSRCILLSATPYNKSYLDLSAQLRLFIPDDRDLGVRPERLIRQMGEAQFRQLQCAPRTLAAFDKSEYSDDWRDLMRLFLVRRTRSFIQRNYARTDPATGRQYLEMPDGKPPSYFPLREPRTVRFSVDDAHPDDPYARLYAPGVVSAIDTLRLPRYGLGEYVKARGGPSPTAADQAILADLSRAGQRLKGFCRTNLFKRLESGGPAFLQSIERHILRNFVFLHALEHDLPLPLGTQDAELLDADATDEDADELLPPATDDATNADPSERALASSEPGADLQDPAHNHPQTQAQTPLSPALGAEEDYRRRAAQVYAQFAGPLKRRFKWLKADFFRSDLHDHLQADARALLRARATCGAWDPAADAKLNALHDLLTQRHPTQKLLIFTQFADTARYLEQQLQARGVVALAQVTGDSDDPTALAWRFSPQSNDKHALVGSPSELRILIATDVLSEGQNLQDCAIIVNYDLPWAIIRLIQRAGRVDRIGQRADTILCYSFLPAEGVDQLLRLRARVRARLQQNADVVGTDERFFEDDMSDQQMLDLYNERAGIMEVEADDGDVDLASQAYSIWKNAILADPSLEKTIAALPTVVYSTRAHQPTAAAPEGVLLYLRTAEGNDALAWVDSQGQPVTESQSAILRAAECSRDLPAQPRRADHHELVAQAARLIAQEEQQIGGQLGRRSGVRARVYERLKAYVQQMKGTLWESGELDRALEDIYRYPLRETASQTLGRQLRAGIGDDRLADLVKALREEDRLCVIHDADSDDQATARDPQILCSLGLRADGART
ncbi:MAG: DEAD/DEAH box helicase, partial [Ktedonobacterales bacterium]